MFPVWPGHPFVVDKAQVVQLSYVNVDPEKLAVNLHIVAPSSKSRIVKAAGNRM